MKELPWFRFYNETISDPKFHHAARILKMDVILLIGVWTVLLSLASKSPVRGKLYVAKDIPLTTDDIARMLGWDHKTTRFVLIEFAKMEMIILPLSTDEDEVISLCHWDDRQYEKDEKQKLDHAKRQKDYVDRKNDALNDGQMTHSSVSVSDSESLIKELNDENSKKYFTISDAERMYLHVTKFASVPSSVIPHLPGIQDLMNAYGYDDAFIRLDNAKSNWVSQKNKTNGASYKLTNPAWLDYAITGETVGAPKVLSREERDQQELERLIAEAK